MSTFKLRIRRPTISVWGLSLLLLAGSASARTFTVGADVVGELVLASSLKVDTLSDLARAYDQGYLEMRWANPTIDPWLPGEETEIIVPSLYVLPDTPRRGVVINVPEMRLYYFKKVRGDGIPEVATHPVSIGRQEWTTPHGVTKIVAKVKNPSWYPPESIREEHAAEGDPLAEVVPPGPDNPLGAFKIKLGLPGYLIHGTNKPYGIGMRVTHGCVRMYPKDVEEIFDFVAVGTPVHIVNQPYKVGVLHNNLYLEVHPHLVEDEERFRDQFSHVVELIINKTSDREVELHWAEMKKVISEKTGIPSIVGKIKGVAVRADEFADSAGGAVNFASGRY